MGKVYKQLALCGVAAVALVNAGPAVAQDQSATQPTAPTATDPVNPPITTPSATASAPAQALAEPVDDDRAPGDPDDILVTARRRSETLISTPVVVSVVGEAAIVRNNANDLSKIAELTPTVIVGAYGANGGGTLAIRGIASPPNNIGFEQAVSVAIDGVQTSDGHVVQLGFFDVQQVEVLKGPQALLFGKNNTAGVISIKTNDPTARLEIGGRQTYEFVGDESITDVAVSGPLTEDVGARLAFRYRYLDGWMRNTSQPLTNPFFNAASGAPIGARQLPGTSDNRPGVSEYLGRLTLKGDFGDVFSARLKLFGARSNDSGAGTYTQNVGPCVGPFPRVNGIADPTADCKVDNRTTSGDLPGIVTSTLSNGNDSGRAFGRLKAFTSTLDLQADLGKLAINSTTGYSNTRYHFMSGNDQTTYSLLYQTDIATIKAFSEELRATSDFDGLFNFMVGGFYQNQKIRDNADVIFSIANFNAATGRYSSFENDGRQAGETLSAFFQGILKFSPTVELAGGARYTHEKKDLRVRNIYGVGPYANFTTVYPGSDEPGVLKGRFRDNNISPELTLTWRPDQNRTVFAAYKTGFKSGGFGVTNPLQTTTLIGDVDFGSERAKGFEVGAKGLFFDNRLRLSAAAYAYRFSDLQVSVFNPDRFAYQVNNAGVLRQRGAELEANFRASDILNLHGAVAYVHNRFRDYIGPCYAYTFPTGTTRANAVAPPNCSFLNATALTLQQDYEGRPAGRSPAWSGNAGFQITAPAGGRQLILSSDLFYSDGYYAADTLEPSVYQKSFFRLNAGITYSPDDERWSIGLLGRNLTNKYYLLYAAGRTGGTGVPGAVGEQRGVVARGREIALQASVRF